MTVDAIVVHDIKNEVFMSFVKQFPGVCAQGKTIDEVKEKLNRNWKSFVQMMSEKEIQMDESDVTAF